MAAEVLPGGELLITQKESSCRGASGVGGHRPRERPQPGWPGRQGSGVELSDDSCGHSPSGPHWAILQAGSWGSEDSDPDSAVLDNSEHLASHLVSVIWLLFHIFHFMLGIKG